MTTFKFFSDPGLTAQLSSLPLQISDVGGVAETVVYFGSPSAGKTLRAASAPGTDPITITPADAAAGAGLAASAVRLSLSHPGLAVATPGAALAVGTSLAGGAAIAVYVRLTLGATAVGSYADLSLVTNAVLES